jgi:hypothetical protein
MDKVVTISKLKEKQNDFKFWQTKSELDRLAATELLRQQFLNFQPHASIGF